jgi:hypothetical protein
LFAQLIDVLSKINLSKIASKLDAGVFMKSSNKQKKVATFSLRTNVKAGPNQFAKDGLDPDRPQRNSFGNQ